MNTQETILKIAQEHLKELVLFKNIKKIENELDNYFDKKDAFEINNFHIIKFHSKDYEIFHIIDRKLKTIGISIFKFGFFEEDKEELLNNNKEFKKHIENFSKNEIEKELEKKILDFVIANTIESPQNSIIIRDEKNFHIYDDIDTQAELEFSIDLKDLSIDLSTTTYSLKMNKKNSGFTYEYGSEKSIENYFNAEINYSSKEQLEIIQLESDMNLSLPYAIINTVQSINTTQKNKLKL